MITQNSSLFQNSIPNPNSNSFLQSSNNSEISNQSQNSNINNLSNSPPLDQEIARLEMISEPAESKKMEIEDSQNNLVSIKSAFLEEEPNSHILSPSNTGEFSRENPNSPQKLYAKPYEKEDFGDDFHSDFEKPSIATRSQSEDEVTIPETYGSPEFREDVSIVLPAEDFEHENGGAKKKPFIIIKDQGDELIRSRPQRKHSIVETEFEQIEIEKPYRINLHVDPNDPAEKFEKIPLGSSHQTPVMPFVLNHGKKPMRYPVKLTWRPDVIDEERWESYLKKVSELVGENITNEEAAAKHLKKWDCDIDRAIEEVKKHKMAYRSRFRVCQMFLRNRANLPKKVL